MEIEVWDKRLENEKECVPMNKHSEMRCLHRLGEIRLGHGWTRIKHGWARTPVSLNPSESK